MQIGVETSRAVDNKRIFVVDEDEIFRAALQFMLHDENETHEVASLDQAYVKALESRPDLILLARSILAEQGTSVVSDIKTAIPGVKVLVVADSLNDTIATEAIRAGASGAVAKPLKLENVRDKVDQMLGRKTAFDIQFTILS